MAIQSFSQFETKFLNFLHPANPYRKPIIITAGYVGLRIGKKVARYIRDHSLSRFIQSNHTITRKVCLAYRYLFPENSSRKYFLEVALPDNLSTTLIIETFLSTLPPALDEPARSDIEKVCITVIRVFFFVYCMDKAHRIVYEVIRRIPHRYAFPIALVFAPTGIYRETFSNGQYIEHRN